MCKTDLIRSFLRCILHNHNKTLLQSEDMTKKAEKWGYNIIWLDLLQFHHITNKNPLEAAQPLKKIDHQSSSPTSKTWSVKQSSHKVTSLLQEQ